MTNRALARLSRRAMTAILLAVATLVAVTLAGCGGGGQRPAPVAPTTQKVTGNGYTYSAPTGWKAFPTNRGVNASGTGSQLLSVAVYKLVKKYDEAKFDAAAAELDKVAAAVAKGRKGKVSASATITVAGRKARSYRIAYTFGGDALQQQVTFVLRGTTEWLLVCRRAVADPDAPCAALLSTFTLTAAR